MQKMFSLFVLFSVLVLNTASSQNKINYPWLYYPQQQSLFYTPFCKKYKCLTDSRYFNESRKGVVANSHSLFSTEYQGPFDEVLSAFFTIYTEREAIYPNNKYGVTQVALKIDIPARYDPRIIANLKKNRLNPTVYNLISDLLYTLVAKRYPAEKILKCFSVGSGLKIYGESLQGRYELDIINHWDFPVGSPITKFATDDLRYKSEHRKAVHVICEEAVTLLKVLVVDDPIGGDPPKK